MKKGLVVGGVAVVVAGVAAARHRPADELADDGVARYPISANGQSRDALYAQAKALGIRGRSRMRKAELAEAISTTMAGAAS
jgi:Rho termination factor, N-terminal domain